MTSRHIVACLSLFLAAGFLLLFASTTLVNADTYNMTYGMTLSCSTPSTNCTGPGTAAGQANGPGSNADMTVDLRIPVSGLALRHSNFQNIYAFNAPTEWITATDTTAPLGAYEASLVSGTTLSLLNAACPSTPNVIVTIPLYSCSTDTSVRIPWGSDGSNLLHATGNLPDGCWQYPQHVFDLTNGQTPRLRLFGEVTVAQGAPPTQVELVVFNPEQARNLSNINTTLTAACGPGSPASCTVGDTTNMVTGQYIAIGSGGTDLENARVGIITPPYSVQLYLNKAHSGSPIYGLPYGDIVDSLGPLSVVIVDNPNQPALSPISEFCAPMLSSTTVFGKTQGQGVMIPAAAGASEATSQCYNGLDDDYDFVADDGCWEVQQSCAATPTFCVAANRNPIANSGLVVNGVATGSHLVGAYSESYRDADGDGFPNIEDACPYTPGVRDVGLDGVTENIRGADGCPAAPTGNIKGCGPAINDCDGDNFLNRQDNCPFDGNPDQLDTDHDNIGDACDTLGNGPNVPDGPYLNVMPRASVCVGEADTDLDGWCDRTECVGGYPTCTGGGLGSNPSDPIGGPYTTPESSKIDIAVSAAENPPGLAPHTCLDLQYYDTVNFPGPGAPVNNDGEGGTNALDSGCDPAWPGDAACTVGGQNDADCDGVPDASDNCPNVANPEQLNTDAKVGTKVDPLPAPLRGDACDADDDQDGATDVAEWAAGTDPKNPCSAPFPIFDVTGGTPGTPDGTINTLDIIVITKLLNKKCRVPSVAQVQ